MRKIVLTFALIALAVPSAAAPTNSPSDNDASLQQTCHEFAGKEVGEGEMKSHINRHVVQRWSDCMMGMPHAR